MSTIRETKLILIFLALFSSGIEDVCACPLVRSPENSTAGFSIQAAFNVFSKLPFKGFNHAGFDYSPSILFLGKPGKKLNIGIDITQICLNRQTIDTTATYGSAHFEATLNSVPIVAVFNMKIWKIDVLGGIGISHIKSMVDAFESRVSTVNWHYCYYYSFGYTQNLNKRMSIGADLKSYSFPKLNKSFVGLALKIGYAI